MGNGSIKKLDDKKPQRIFFDILNKNNLNL